MKFRKMNNNFPGKVFGNVVLAMSILMLSQCKKESADIVPESSISAKALQTVAATAPGSASGYALEKSLPSGYKKDGSVDYTDYVQKAILANSTIVFPAFPILINDKGLTVGSNKTNTFLKGSEIWMKASKLENFSAIHINKASNVTLNFPVIVGDRYIHKGTTGQWGHGISIDGSSNVVISNAKVTNCWGDGIYIGNSGSTVSKNILLSAPYLKSNRRDGLSIISVDGLTVNGGYFAFSDGNSPYCGINMEPNNSSDELKNIKFNGVKTEGNLGYGIQWNTKRMYGNGSKKISIDIVDHVDRKSMSAIKGSSYIDYRKSGESITGNINIVNPDYQKQTSGIPVYTSMFEDGIKLTITNATIQTLTGAILSNSLVTSLLTGRGGINKDANYQIINK